MATIETLPSGPLECLSPEETQAELAAGRAVLVDVRTPAEFAFEHIRGALLMPLSEFEVSALPTGGPKRIIFSCGSGVRSKLTAEAMMRELGGGSAHLCGGIAAWKRAGLPFLATDPQTGAMRDVKVGS